MSTFAVSHQKPHSLYPLFSRKGGDRLATHYCPGCGHGVLHKLLAEAIDDLGIQNQTILVSPVGCSVFAYHYFDVGNVQAAHGRAPAVATGLKRSRPESIVISYQGDGDLASIGIAEIIHAANRGENITVFFVNNAIYGMTGGQMAPTTLLGQRTVTTPRGRNARLEGHPLRICELLSSLPGVAYLERVAFVGPRNHMKARQAIRKALRNQMEGRGFSLVEVLSACPMGWKLTPLQAWQWIEKHLLPVYPLGVFKEAPPCAPLPLPQSVNTDQVIGLLDLPSEPTTETLSEHRAESQDKLCAHQDCWFWWPRRPFDGGDAGNRRHEGRLPCQLASLLRSRDARRHGSLPRCPVRQRDWHSAGRLA